VHWLFSFNNGGPPGGLGALTKILAPRAASASPVHPARRRGKAASPRHAALLGAFLLLASLLTGGCAASKWTVKPHQRELLADRIMQLDSEAQEREAEEHILSNREGAVGGTGTSGGGCGCN